jgi:type IV pilus assembly protein PilB
VRGHDDGARGLDAINTSRTVAALWRANAKRRPMPRVKTPPGDDRPPRPQQFAVHNGELLGSILVSEGIASSRQVNGALRAQRAGDTRRIGEILVERGVIDEHGLAAALARQYGVHTIEFDPTHLIPEAIARLDREIARSMRAVPVRLSGSGLIVAVDEVPTRAQLQLLAAHTGVRIGFGLTTQSQISRGLELAYGLPNETETESGPDESGARAGEAEGLPPQPVGGAASFADEDDDQDATADLEEVQPGLQSAIPEADVPKATASVDPGQPSADPGRAVADDMKGGQVRQISDPEITESTIPWRGSSVDRRRLGEVLIERGLLSDEDLQRALQLQTTSGRRLGEELVALGVLDERSVAQALAEQFDLPLIDLRQRRPDPDALALVPESLARGLQAVPMHDHDHAVDVAVADPGHPHLADELNRATGKAVNLLVAPVSEVRRAIDQSYRALTRVAKHVREFELSAPRRAGVQTELQRAVDHDAPVVQVVNLIITQALRDRASDVHLEPQGTTMRVRMRIDGALHEVLELPIDMGPAIVSRIKVMADMNIVERRKPQDGQIEMTVDDREIDIRVATAPVIFGEKVALRLLDKSRSLYKLGDLGMSSRTAHVFSDLVRSPFGMMVCAGPTGSGKTTTLYATLSEIDTSERNVMTIEDPVEYVLPSVNQIQINELAGVTFADGLKSILRQDPDVILVGEVRDVETARIAVQSALTGHFVLSSLHATDAASAVHRLLDMGIEPFLIAPSLLAVAGQRLVRRICPECRVAYEPPGNELVFFAEIGGADKPEFFHGGGCNFCSGTGFQERIGVYEVLRMTDEMRQLIVDQPSQGAMRELAIEQGMTPLRDEAVRLVNDDVTTISEILRSVYPL